MVSSTSRRALRSSEVRIRSRGSDLLGARTSPYALSAPREMISRRELNENQETVRWSARCGRGRPRSQLKIARPTETASPLILDTQNSGA
jgi:hypothetical protein